MVNSSLLAGYYYALVFRAHRYTQSHPALKYMDLDPGILANLVQRYYN
ncbi:MAG: hypothetical protein HON77_00600 [Gammaproteobacteria bacterium]|nr:hypothetical protein [Gammaproteobacteria bacterium]MDG1232760.1 hypothetical protein [Pseudomonadales bacterium]